MTPAILFYDVVLWIHVTAVVLAFGVTFAYPLMGPFIARHHPGSVAAFHAAQALVGKRLIAPAGGIALLAGAYLATDREYWDKVWVTVPLVILVAILGLGGAFFGPHEERAAKLAERDVAAAGGGPPQFSDEYVAVRNKIAAVGAVASALVIVALFFMIAKPGGY